MLIAVPIQKSRQQAVLKVLKNLKGKADMAEIWLDQIVDLNLETLFQNKPLPVIAVCKSPDEKGAFKGSAKAKLALLKRAAALGADYIDVPFPNTRFGRAKVIISHHDFKKTPSSKTLLQKARAMRAAGADIVKIAVTARTLGDTLRVILLAQTLQAEKIPHILIAMGRLGALSRVLTPTLGGTLMFAPLSKKDATAPGQLTVKELRAAWNLIKKV